MVPAARVVVPVPDMVPVVQFSRLVNVMLPAPSRVPFSVPSAKVASRSSRTVPPATLRLAMAKIPSTNDVVLLRKFTPPAPPTLESAVKVARMAGRNEDEPW